MGISMDEVRFNDKELLFIDGCLNNNKEEWKQKLNEVDKIKLSLKITALLDHPKTEFV